jgi:hypothetical protein
LVEEKRDRRLAELACACEERTPGKTLQSQVICVNAFRGRIGWSFPSAYRGVPTRITGTFWRAQLLIASA